MTSRRPFRSSWPVLVVAGLVLLYSGFAGVVWWVQSNAHQIGATAQREFGGDEVQALLRLVSSDRHDLRDRNRAVYALGVMGDQRALPVLERYHTGGQCDHARELCQKELSKAVDRCHGKNWAPSWLPLLPHRPRATT